jgi:hypothetical protein
LSVRRAQDSSKRRDWRSILEGDIDNIAMDNLALAADATSNVGQAGNLTTASEAFEELANRVRKMIERES